MVKRRQEKVSRTIRNTVSEVIQKELSDPRIKGLISVTRVDTSADLRSARVYLSLLGIESAQQELSLRGIRHAGGYIQSRLAKCLSMKSCPTLSFYLDDSLKKGFLITRLIDAITAERELQSGPSRESEIVSDMESEDEGQQ